jgi:hypothetical protein
LLSHVPQAVEAYGIALLNRLDGMAGLREGLRRIAADRGDWAGIPMPMSDTPLVIEPSYPKAAELMAIGRNAEPEEPGWTKVNEWYSRRRRQSVLIGRDPAGKLHWGYSAEHPHWGIAYSGGKDSSATLTLIMHLIKSGQIAAPRSLTVYYADTRMELLPLAIAAQDVMALGTRPEGWEGNEPTADTPLDTIYRDGSVQPLMPPASPRTPMAMASWSRGR